MSTDEKISHVEFRGYIQKASKHHPLNEEVRYQLVFGSVWIGVIFVKSRTPTLTKTSSSTQKFPVFLRGINCKILHMRGIARDFHGVRDLAIIFSPPSMFLTAAVAIVVRGHNPLQAIPWSRNSADIPTT